MLQELNGYCDSSSATAILTERATLILSSSNYHGILVHQYHLTLCISVGCGSHYFCGLATQNQLSTTMFRWTTTVMKDWLLTLWMGNTTLRSQQLAGRSVLWHALAHIFCSQYLPLVIWTHHCKYSTLPNSSRHYNIGKVLYAFKNNSLLVIIFFFPVIQNQNLHHQP